MAEDRTDLIPRVTRETFLDVTSGKHDVDGKKIVIIDCRFEYEYAGGHIQDAINFNDKELLAKRLFDDAAESGMTLIFHCEYSQFRAPKMYVGL
jgi:M-phase inducer tyrosine phosphatase